MCCLSLNIVKTWLLHHLIVSSTQKTSGYMAQLLGDFEGIEKSLPNSSSRGRILSSNQSAIHKDLGLYFKIQSIGYILKGWGLTSHGSVAFSYLPPSEMILSSNKNGTSYWNPISIPKMSWLMLMTYLDFINQLFFQVRESSGRPPSKDWLASIIHNLYKSANRWSR